MNNITKQQMMDFLDSIQFGPSTDIKHAEVHAAVRALVDVTKADDPVVEPWDDVPDFNLTDYYRALGNGDATDAYDFQGAYWLHGNIGTLEEMQARVRVWKAEALIKRWCAHLWYIESRKDVAWSPFSRRLDKWLWCGMDNINDKGFPFSMCTPFDPTKEYQGRIWLTDEIKEAYKTYFNDGAE